MHNQGIIVLPPLDPYNPRRLQYLIMKLFVVALCIAVAAAAPAPADGGFSAVDVNGDGKITRAELNTLFQKFDDNSDNAVDLGEFILHYSMGTGLSYKASGYIFFLADADESSTLTTVELEGIFIAFDANGDGEVTAAEFGGYMQQLAVVLNQLKVTGDKLEAVFDSTDANSDGELNASEFGGVFGSADTNGDGKVTEAEFIAMWKSKVEDNEANAKYLFALMDSNKDGAYGDNAAERAMVVSVFDDNGDGKVSRDEFNYTFIFFAAREAREVAASGAVGY